MSEHRMERNGIILVSTEILVKLMGMVTTIVVARFLGADQFGFISFAYALAGVTLMGAHYGFDKLAVRELARRPARASHFLIHISVFKISVFFPAALVCMVAAYWQSPNLERLFDVALVFVAEAALQYTLFICGFFRAIQKMGREGFIRFCIAMLSFATGVPMILTGWGVTGLVFSRMAVMLFCFYLAFRLLRKDFDLRWTPIRWRYLRRLLGMGLPLALIVVGVTMYMSTGPLLLGILLTDEDVGYFQAGLTIITPLVVVADAVAGTSLPMLAQTWGKDEQAFAYVIKKSIRYLMLAVIPLSMGMILESERGMGLIFGEEYHTSAGVLMILALVLIPDYINIFLAVLLISAKQEKYALRATYTGIVVNGLGCYLLIPEQGAMGAAAAWLLAEIAVFFIQFSVLYRSITPRDHMHTLFRITLSAGVMALVVKGCHAASLPLLFSIPAGIASYILALMLFRELTQDEVQRAKSVFQSFLPGAKAESPAPEKPIG